MFASLIQMCTRGSTSRRPIAEFHKHDPTLAGTRRARRARATRSPSAMTPTAPLGTRPFPHAVGHGAIKEFPLFSGGKGYHQGNTGNSRIIMQENGHGGAYFIQSFAGSDGALIFMDRTHLPWCPPDMASLARIWKDHHVAKHTQYNYHDTDHSAALHRMFGSSVI